MKKLLGVLLTLAFVVGLAGASLADSQETDNDVFSPGNQNIVSLSANAGATVNTTAQITITFSGNNHLPNGAGVTFDVSASQTDLPTGYSVSSVNGTVPNDWSDGPSQRQEAMGTSNISFTAPSSDTTFHVKWNASGPACIGLNPSCLTGSNDLTINLTVTAACTANYTVAFLQPFDGSTPSKLITNTMKNGRTVPVKVTIYDNCAQAFVTDLSGKSVNIQVNTASLSPPATDAVESYSDAGTSNGDTTAFRWSADGFWIFNLDSSGKGFGLTTGTCYEVHVKVDATVVNTTYALLKPVK